MGVPSPLTWLSATATPWLLALAVLVSFTGMANNDPEAGISTGPAYGQLPRRSGRLIGPASAALPDLDDDDGPVLRPDRKRNAGADPQPARNTKGAPSTEIRPSLSRRALDLAHRPAPVGQDLAFRRDERLLPPTILMSGSVSGPDWESSRSLEPWTGENPSTTGNASSVQSPTAAAAGSTGPVRGNASSRGETPSTSRATALSSATPAPADAVPLAIAAAPVSAPILPSVVARPELNLRPRYADLIAPASLEREQRCLAEAVYFEARSEPEAGQAAVAQVVLNRVRSGLYPASVCGVVYQNRHRHLACQFTFACEGKPLRIAEGDAWDIARRVARDVTEGRTYLTEVGASTHYHAEYVRPSWAGRLKRMDVIGRHIFYQLRPGQT